MSLQSTLVKQFHKPSGLLGRLAGWIMATRESNLQRNQWTVDLLGIEPAHQVLELGPGPGVTLGLLLERTPAGSVTAIDHSDVMLDACHKRHGEWVNNGRLVLIEAPFPGIPDGETFDRIIAVNSLQFDALNSEAMTEIVSHLKPGGVLAVTMQPRGQNPTREKALAFGEKLKTLFLNVGLTNPRLEVLEMEPVCAVCVLAEVQQM